MFTYKSTVTLSNTASNVINFLSLPNPFIAIGRAFEWTQPFDDERIPEPSPDQVLDNVISYVRPYLLRPIYQSVCGSIEINGSKWSAVDPNLISYVDGQIKPSISHLHLQVRINPDQYNSDSFRSISLLTHTQLIPSANPNLLNYEPSFISNPGILHWIAYSNPIYRIENKVHVIDLAIPL